MMSKFRESSNIPWKTNKNPSNSDKCEYVVGDIHVVSSDILRKKKSSETRLGNNFMITRAVQLNRGARINHMIIPTTLNNCLDSRNFIPPFRECPELSPFCLSQFHSDWGIFGSRDYKYWEFIVYYVYFMLLSSAISYTAVIVWGFSG